MQLLLNLVEQYGLWLVFANVLAVQFGAPVPAYPTLIVVGAVAVARKLMRVGFKRVRPLAGGLSA
jgi:membrane protein DedA with SNARE-associated domain